MLHNVLQVLVHLGAVGGGLFRNGAHSGDDPHPTGSHLTPAYPSAPMTWGWQPRLVPGGALGDDQHVGLSYDVAQFAPLSVGEGTR